MKSTLTLSFFIFASILATIYGDCGCDSGNKYSYPCNENYSSCAYPGLGNKKACRGSGITDVANVIGRLGSKRYCIIGNKLDLYYVFSGEYKSLPGAEAVYFLSVLWAYIMEVPNADKKGSTFYLIKVTSCPEVIILNCQTKGYLTDSLAYKTIYTVCLQYSKEYSCPCNVFTTDSYPERGINYYIYNVDSPITLSNLISFQFYPLKKSVTQKYVLDEIKSQGFCVDPTQNKCYVQRGYETIGSNCSVPASFKPLGVALYESGFNFELLFTKEGLCLLATKTVELISSGQFASSYFFYPERISWIGEPYDFVITCRGYIFLNLGNLINRAYWELC